jgi:3-methyl-2-oxobutanoate hydroxymethyltransferase
MDKVSIPALRQMKLDGDKIVAVVAWDFQIAQIAERAGVEIISVGDSVGINLWGHTSPEEITIDEMLVVCKAVRRGTKRALLSCDLPHGPLQQGVDGAMNAAFRMVKEAGADLVKLDGANEFPDAVEALARAGIPVWAQFGKQSPLPGEVDEIEAARWVRDARTLETAGASLIDFIHSGPVAGPAVVSAVSIPVLGGMGGGPWLDGRIRMVHAAIGYAATMLESHTETYANVARITLDALTAYANDVRAGRHIKGSLNRLTR